MVTNDDGIDSIGLHVLARTMRQYGDVVIAAPDQEYSGFGAAIGSIWLMKPEVHRTTIDGIDEAWAVNGAPALCAMFGRLGAFGDIDLVVSGINPGANVGRSVYHSGTVGACLTARNGGINQDVFIDNLVITAVPAPGAAVALMGLAGLGRRRRRD